MLNCFFSALMIRLSGEPITARLSVQSLPCAVSQQVAEYTLLGRTKRVPSLRTEFHFSPPGSTRVYLSLSVYWRELQKKSGLRLFKYESLKEIFLKSLKWSIFQVIDYIQYFKRQLDCDAGLLLMQPAKPSLSALVMERARGTQEVFLNCQQTVERCQKLFEDFSKKFTGEISKMSQSHLRILTELGITTQATSGKLELVRAACVESLQQLTCFFRVNVIFIISSSLLIVVIVCVLFSNFIPVNLLWA